jgi:hypothetical protein
MKHSFSLVPALLLCASLAFAQFEDDEWADFDYQHAGLTQTEFQNVKESGMNKAKLMYLLEVGISPSEYLKEPWKDLGVSEKKWLEERAGGMENSDIDRTYKNYGGNQGLAYLSFLVPSLYQWNTDDVAKAVAMDITWIAAVGITWFLYSSKNDDATNTGVYGLIGVAAVHIWSGADALISTLWDSNPDAKSFSWGIVPTGKNSFAAAAAFRF